MRLIKQKNAHSSDSSDMLRILDDSTPFAVKEAFRTLYTNVLYLPIEDKCKKIAVTSAFSGEGKTYVSINLAITLAQNSDNRKVLLVDMDMRKPRVARLLKGLVPAVKKDDGLSEFLAGIVKEPTIYDSRIPNLSILFSGAESANPAGLINSSKMAELIKMCEENYDYIIFDTPPVNIVSDAVLLVNHINGYIITTRADYSNINDLSDAIDSIEAVEGTIFGIVLSAINPKNSRYGRYGKYGKYKNYSGYSEYGK